MKTPTAPELPNTKKVSTMVAWELWLEDSLYISESKAELISEKIWEELASTRHSILEEVREVVEKLLKKKNVMIAFCSKCRSDESSGTADKCFICGEKITYRNSEKNDNNIYNQALYDIKTLLSELEEK